MSKGPKDSVNLDAPGSLAGPVRGLPEGKFSLGRIKDKDSVYEDYFRKASDD